MVAGEPQQPDDNDRTRRQRARVAAWCQAAGAVLAVVTLTCSLLGVISAQEAVALGVPAALLIGGGLIVGAALDAADGERLGFRAGLRVGKVLRWLRSVFRGGRLRQRGR